MSKQLAFSPQSLDPPHIKVAGPPFSQVLSSWYPMWTNSASHKLARITPVQFPINVIPKDAIYSILCASVGFAGGGIRVGVPVGVAQGVMVGITTGEGVELGI